MDGLAPTSGYADETVRNPLPPAIAAVPMGLVAAVIGYASSLAVTLQGLKGVGASAPEAASGLMALSVAMGLAGIVLSLRTRMPISIAWSTPGAALLASAGHIDGGFSVAVGAFLISGFLVVVAGVWRRLGDWVAAIPASLASAMLAGVLIDLCFGPIKAVATMPVLALPVVVVWFVVSRFSRLYAVPGALALALVLLLVTRGGALAQAGLWSGPVLVVPKFSLAAVVGIALPLFFVTMASQNIPGLAVLNGNGYRPKGGPLLWLTGLGSLLVAPFGGHGICLAAITAAMCAGPDAHPDPGKRYWAAVAAGALYVVLGLLSGLATAFITLAPPQLLEAVAGLALLGAFGNSLSAALAARDDREAVTLTFLITASGQNFLGVGCAFWGLAVGGLVYTLGRLSR